MELVTKQEITTVTPQRIEELVDRLYKLSGC
jgi:hypothetical protein